MIAKRNYICKNCECAIYMSNGTGKCMICQKPMKPIKIKKKQNENL